LRRRCTPEARGAAQAHRRGSRATPRPSLQSLKSRDVAKQRTAPWTSPQRTHRLDAGMFAEVAEGAKPWHRALDRRACELWIRRHRRAGRGVRAGAPRVLATALVNVAWRMARKARHDKRNV